MSLTEDDMRLALGLEPDVKKFGVDINGERRIFPHTLVTYSVRNPGGGSTFKYEYKSRSISVDMAKMEAEKEIRGEGSSCMGAVGYPANFMSMSN